MCVAGFYRYAMATLGIQKAMGRAMRKRRMALGFSQDSFADQIEMHRAYYSSLERGERNATLSTLKRVADGLDSSISELAKQAGI